MTGHVRRRGVRSWELKFDIGTDPATGRRKTRYVSFKGAKREAEVELARLVAAAAKGGDVSPSRETVNGFLDRWERDWAAINVSPKTAETYQHHLKHVRRALGGKRIQHLRPVDLVQLYAHLTRNVGLAPRTVGHIHRILHRALGHAVQWHSIERNPAELVSPPPVSSHEIAILAEGDAQAVLAKLAGRTIYPLAMLALATGMRRGELCALRWQDVDLDRAQLRVEQSLEQTSAGLRFKAPKTRYGRRLISLPPSAVAELRAHWKAQQEQRMSLGMGRATPSDLVFATFEGKPRSPNGLTKEWSAAMANLGRPEVTLHSLRHTHASQLIAASIDVLTVSRRLGHGSPAITLSVYGHLFSNTDDRAAAVVEAAFSSIRTE
jgi:integrase